MRITIENGKFVIPANDDIEVSTATLNRRDLLPIYKELLGEYGKDFELPPPEDDWWEYSDSPLFMEEDFINKIDSMTPNTHVFGSHNGNGSLIGFWTCKEEL